MMRRAASTVLVPLLLFTMGCTDQAAEAPVTESPQEEEVTAVEAPEVDTVDVLDDERSLERRLRDATIASEVRLALVDARDLRIFDFEPVVVNGRVLLRGIVNTQEQRSRAEAVARDVRGVREVTNEVTALEQPVLAAEDEGDASGIADAGSAAAGNSGEASSSPDAAAGEPESSDGAPSSEETTGSDASDESAASQPQATYHTVRSGESLWTISRQHGVTIDQIRQLNGLRSNSLRPGQRLRVK